MIPQKDEMRYRNEANNCEYCQEFTKGDRIPGQLVRRGTCKHIPPGPERTHSVRGDHTCDRQVTTYKPPKIWPGEK